MYKFLGSAVIYALQCWLLFLKLVLCKYTILSITVHNSYRTCETYKAKGKLMLAFMNDNDIALQRSHLQI